VKRRFVWVVSIISLILTNRSDSIGIRNLRLEDLVSASEAIAIAEVGHAKMIGPSPPIVFRGHPLQSEQYSCDVAVRQIIKGRLPGRFVVKYSLPISFVGYQGLHPGTRLVFLRREGDSYSPADYYYPDFPAVPMQTAIEGSQSEEEDDTRIVANAMMAVIRSPISSLAEKSEILRVDYALPAGPEVIAALREGLANTHDSDFEQRLDGELLRFGDIGVLPDVVRSLMTDSASDSEKVWLLYVVGNRLKDPRAIPALRPMLKSSDSSLREAALEALWHISDPTAVHDLAQGLHDADERARFYAVRGLADIAKELDWGGPSESEFHEHEQKYVTHWQDWVQSLGQSQ
jgi:hypothetical protein